MGQLLRPGRETSEWKDTHILLVLSLVAALAAMARQPSVQIAILVATATLQAGVVIACYAISRGLAKKSGAAVVGGRATSEWAGSLRILVGVFLATAAAAWVGSTSPPNEQWSLVIIVGAANIAAGLAAGAYSIARGLAKRDCSH